jgi:hypothetical protein
LLKQYIKYLTNFISVDCDYLALPENGGKIGKIAKFDLLGLARSV